MLKSFALARLIIEQIDYHDTQNYRKQYGNLKPFKEIGAIVGQQNMNRRKLGRYAVILIAKYIRELVD